MNQLKAMRRTVALAKQHPWWSPRDGTTVEHLEKMLKVMEKKKMGPDKMGRWLGWAQAIVVAYSPGMISLEDFKELNRKCK